MISFILIYDLYDIKFLFKLINWLNVYQYCTNEISNCITTKCQLTDVSYRFIESYLYYFGVPLWLLTSDFKLDVTALEFIENIK